MQRTVFTIHAVDIDKLAGVIGEMQKLGSPSIRVVDCGDYLMALEGVHRIAAAAHLAIPLKLIELEQNDLVDANSLDWQNLRPGEQYTAGELAGEAYSPSSGIYTLHADFTVSAVRP